MTETASADDIETLRRRAEALAAKADAAARAFERSTALRFFLVFFPIPFVVLLFRLHLEVWHYYAAGGLGIVLVALLGTLDRSATRKRDHARAAAEHARTAYEAALMTR